MKSSRFTKFISIVLTLALLLQIAPLQAFATTDETVPPEEVVEAAEITAPAAAKWMTSEVRTENISACQTAASFLFPTVCLSITRTRMGSGRTSTTP